MLLFDIYAAQMDVGTDMVCNQSELPRSFLLLSTSSGSPPSSVAISPDGETVAAGAADGKVKHARMI